jgi:hypothetical protein
MPLHQRGKRVFGLAGSELPHQRHVIADHHLQMDAQQEIRQCFLAGEVR